VALELASRMTGMPHDVSDELFARLRTHYTDAAIVELASIAALENYRSRFNRVFRVEAQGFFCVLPQADSLGVDPNPAIARKPLA
jgi:alkylhydroperoxidase family enzyme